MYTQARLPGATMVEEIVKKTTDAAKVYANNMVRVNSDVQKIDKFFHVTKPHREIDIKTDENNTEESKIKEKNIIVKVVEEENRIPEIVVKYNNEVINESIIEEPLEENKLPDKWKTHTAADKANITYIDPKESFKTRIFQYERVDTKLTSVKQLRLDVENSCNMNLREILANLIFIACIDCHRSLVQYSTKLYLCNTTRLA